MQGWRARLAMANPFADFVACIEQSVGARTMSHPHATGVGGSKAATAEYSRRDVAAVRIDEQRT